MSDPICPAHYLCTFTPQNKYVVAHNIGPWYNGDGGLAVAITGIVAVVIIICTAIYYIEGRAKERENVLERKHNLEMQEQRTMQIDAAKGNPEMLKIVKEMQR